MTLFTGAHKVCLQVQCPCCTDIPWAMRLSIDAIQRDLAALKEAANKEEKRSIFEQIFGK